MITSSAVISSAIFDDLDVIVIKTVLFDIPVLVLGDGHSVFDHHWQRWLVLEYLIPLEEDDK